MNCFLLENKIIPKILVLYLFIFISFNYNCFARSYTNCKDGSCHKIDFKNVLEGLKGKNLTELYKSISSDLIDKRLPKNEVYGFSCGERGNHRWFGHWGLGKGGKIPFNKSPLKECLNRYSSIEQKKIRNKVRTEWQQRVKIANKLTSKFTGLPKNQAKALTALIYNTHLLGDWVPGNKMTSQLANVKSIQETINNNLKSLFPNSNLTKQISKDISLIKLKNPKKYAEAILQVLKKHNIGKELNKYYSRFLMKRGIYYTILGSQNLKLLLSKQSVLEKTKYFPKKFKDFNKIKSNFNSKTLLKPGIITSNGKLLISISEGASAGILIFSIESGYAGYQLIKGDIWHPEFERKIQDATIKGVAVGGGIAVAVFLGANPAGFVIMGVAAGSYFIVDKTLRVWHEYKDSKYINVKDLQDWGIEVDSILNINDLDIPLNFDKWK